MTEKNKEIVVIDETTIKSKIYYLRNQKVMLDFELAEIYGYSTKRFNRTWSEAPWFSEPVHRHEKRARAAPFFHGRRRLPEAIALLLECFIFFIL